MTLTLRETRLFRAMLAETRVDRAYWAAELANAVPGTHRHELATAKLAACDRFAADIVADLRR